VGTFPLSQSKHLAASSIVECLRGYQRGIALRKAKRPNSEPGSKQARVIAMLKSPAGTTIDAMMKATGWQQHSVRGFLAGVVRKRLKLKLESNKVDGERVYKVTGGEKAKSGSRSVSKRRSS